jgi:hypothetical protein
MWMLLYLFFTASSYLKKWSPVIAVRLGLYNRLCCIVEYTVLTEPIIGDWYTVFIIHE